MLRCIATFSHLQWAQSADYSAKYLSEKVIYIIIFLICNTVLQLPSLLAALSERNADDF